jgi:hypothetical protein
MRHCLEAIGQHEPIVAHQQLEEDDEAGVHVVEVIRVVVGRSVGSAVELGVVRICGVGGDQATEYLHTKDGVEEEDAEEQTEESASGREEEE